jgi:hypothetical protein
MEQKGYSEEIRAMSPSQFHVNQTHGSYLYDPFPITKTASSAGNIALSVVVGVLLIVIAITSILFFQFNLVETSVLLAVCLIMYGILLGALFFRAPRHIIIEKPIIKEKIKEVTTPVIIEKQNPPAPVVQPARPSTKKKIIKDLFVGSTETKTFHKMACRLGRLIKRKYRITGNTQLFFKLKNFKACKVCLKK